MIQRTQGPRSRLTSLQYGHIWEQRYYMDLILQARCGTGILPIYGNLVVVGTGAGWSIWGNHAITTGAAAGSSAKQHAKINYPLGTHVDWTKQHIWLGDLITDGTHSANTRCYDQMKASTGAVNGPLGVPGMGFELLNVTWYFESYNTARQSTSIGVTQGAWTYTRFMVVHNPNIPQIDVYLNWSNTPVVTITNTAHIPQTGTSNNCCCWVSVENQADATNVFMVPATHYFAEFE